MATVSAGRGTARHRRKPPRRLAAERLLAVDGAWLLCFALLVTATVRHPEPAAILCGICGITGPGVARQGARCAARLWDLRHRITPPAQRGAEEAALSGPTRSAQWERDRDPASADGEPRSADRSGA
jgi:hypothetical protein